MAYKTCPNCGSRVFEHGCVNCDEMEYISMQQEYEPMLNLIQNQKKDLDRWVNDNIGIPKEKNGEPKPRKQD